ncbi:unnamed protein product, partial [Durusdinium trenchii]
ELYKLTKQSAESIEKSGVGKIGNVSKSSNVEKNFIKMAIDTSVALATDCSKRVSNLNEQVVENTSCEKYNTINFAAQNATASIVSECTATAAGQSSALQDLTAIADQTAKATLKGGGLMEIILLMLMLPLMLFLIPLAIRKGFTAFRKKKPPMNGLMKASIACFVLFGLYFFLVYPGFAAWRFGAAPWPNPKSTTKDSEGDVVCQDGVYKKESILNTFMFVDRECTIARAEDPSATCDATDQQIYYEGCGLFGACNATDFAADRGSFEDASTACAKIPPDLVQYCRASDLALSLFADTYGSCKKCTDPALDLFGLFVAEGADCVTADVDNTKYAAIGEVMNDSGTFVANTCDSATEAGFCYATEAALLAESPDDCMDVAYQQRKKTFSKLVRACQEIDATVVNPNGDSLAWEGRHVKFAVIGGVGLALLLGLALLFMILSKRRQDKDMKEHPDARSGEGDDREEGGAGEKGGKPGFSWKAALGGNWAFVIVLVFFILMWVVVAVPVGLLASALKIGIYSKDESSPGFKDTDTPQVGPLAKVEDWDNDSMRLNGIVLTSLVSFLIFAWIALFIYRKRKAKAKEKKGG